MAGAVNLPTHAKGQAESAASIMASREPLVKGKGDLRKCTPVPPTKQTASACNDTL
jgi:hypothetical protein